jgi:hypothetical protein
LLQLVINRFLGNFVLIVGNWKVNAQGSIGARYLGTCLAYFFVWGVLLGLVVGCGGDEAAGGDGTAVSGENVAVVTAVPPTETITPDTPAPPLTPTSLPEPGEFVLTPLPPTETPTPEPPTATPPVTPTPRRLNGVLMTNVVVMPKDVQAHVKEIYARGQEMGRDPNAFSKIGDSTIEALNFFARFDGADGQDGGYNLGEYAYLERVIDYYSGSFGREGYALVRGLNTWSIFDPFWADDEACLSGETVLECEFRVHNPSVVLIRLGANDSSADLFDENLRLIVAFSIENGVVPVLATRPDQTENENDEINARIRDIGVDYEVPVWNLAKVLATLPNDGVSSDGVHLTAYYAYDYTAEIAFERGNAVQNLTGLIALDTVLQCVGG